jgi:predicted nucleic acid-binding Zn ribbon protein
VVVTSHSNTSRTVGTDALGGKRKERGKRASAAYHRILRKANAEPTSPRARRVLWLLEALIKAENLRIELYELAADHLLVTDHRGVSRWVSKSNPDQAPKYDPDEGVFTDPQLRALELQFNGVLKEIEQKLKRYRWTPTVRCGEFHGLMERYIWPTKSEEDSWENWAVFWLIGHATMDSSGRSPGLILRFKHCRQCGVWFYAVTEHQEHCSERCRRKFYSQGPEYRAARAAYMRKHRRDIKEMQRRQDEARRRRSVTESKERTVKNVHLQAR